MWTRGNKGLAFKINVSGVKYVRVGQTVAAVPESESITAVFLTVIASAKQNVAIAAVALFLEAC
jgi:hypothetical protein